MKSMTQLVASIFAVASLAVSPEVRAEAPSLQPNAAVPGAVLSITGKGFGPFKSTTVNQVKFQGARRSSSAGSPI